VVDVSNPMSSLIPGGRGAVLDVLVHAGIPLSGRQVAELAGGAVGVTRTAKILAELARAGIVNAEARPPAVIYSLNDDHLAATAIRELCGMSEVLVDRLRSELAEWDVPAAGAWLFGSAARRDGGLDSDIDVLVVQPAGAVEESVWETQILDLGGRIQRWTGNAAAVIDYSEAEIAQLVAAGEELPEAVRHDGVHLAGRRHLVPRRAAGAS
jgi:hypothetical protein